MRKLTRLFAGVLPAAAAAAFVAGTVVTVSAAPDDPPKGITPQPFDIVGVGSPITEYVFDQISTGYNATVKAHNADHPWLFSWDAVPPPVTGPGTFLVPKAGCAKIAPGPLADLKELFRKDGKFFCIDFIRSPGARNPTAPPPGKGGVFYVEFARDAVTWAVRSAAHGGSDAPASLTKAQLAGIFTCKTTNWNLVGGKKGAIKAFLPQPGSGTLAAWLKFLGITQTGSCVSQVPQENEGTFAGFNSPNAVFIYSIGAYVAQKFHSPKCGARPAKGQNAFGCDTTGVLGLDKINGIGPLTSAKVPSTNLKFPAHFFRTLFNIVRWSATTKDHIDPRADPIFGHDGFLCTSPIAKTQIANYGWIQDPACGKTS